MKEEKMKARKKVREIVEEYQERTKNERPKKIEGLDIKTVGSHAEFGPPEGNFTSPRTVAIDSERFVREVCAAGIDENERELRINEHKNINKVIDRKYRQKYEMKEPVGNIDYSKIEMSNGDHIIYGIDEIGPIFELYGKNSEIYNAMTEGKVVSGLIKESLQVHQQAGEIEIAKREESLLARCLRREQEKGLSL
ncbi:MAG: hypothetical protein IJ415_04555 [Clostridia bacterium]|nr:hypothetical protein [Clostridia bacterium]